MGLPALREQSKRVACNRGVRHCKCDPRQHTADLLPPPWLVLLQGTLPATRWLLPARGTSHGFLPHLWPPWGLVLISAKGLFGASLSCWPPRLMCWALEEPGSGQDLVLWASRLASSKGQSLTASLPAGPGCAGPVLRAERGGARGLEAGLPRQEGAERGSHEEHTGG